MTVKKFCIRHGIVDPAHRCTPDGFVGTENQIRYEKAKNHGTLTTHWKKLRAQALERDGYTCTLRHKHCTVRATTVHLDPRLRGDHRNATLADCRSACRRCHGKEDAPRSKGGTG